MRSHFGPSRVGNAQTLYRKYVKRILDIAGALAILVLLSPILLIVAITIRVCDGSPVLFRQERPGLKTRTFTLVKFRTMDPETFGGSVSSRTTCLGKWLRALSLDELPQAVNVLRGEMSMVGPRPLLEEYLTLYDSEQQRRHDVRPGITGLAQVRGRNSLSWDEKLHLDTVYVDQSSFLLDLRICLMTIGAVLSRRSIDPPTVGGTQHGRH